MHLRRDGLPSVTRIAAVNFSVGETQYLRVYYLHGSKLKELSYNSGKGWHATSGQEVVAHDAKEDTPIAAVSCFGGSEIRVYYLDQHNTLCQRILKTASPEESGVWQEVEDSQYPKAARNSHIAAACLNQDCSTIYVFYQAEDTSIQQLTITEDDNWTETVSTSFEGVKLGTGITVLCGGDNGELRLFYQDQSDLIVEKFSNTEEPWKLAKIPKYKLPPGAPIGAVAWNYDERNFQIRLYSVDFENTLVEMSYKRETGGWKRNITKINRIESVKGPVTGLAAVRNAIGKISCYYRTGHNVFAVWDPDTETLPQLPGPDNNLRKNRRERFGRTRGIEDELKVERFETGESKKPVTAAAASIPKEPEKLAAGSELAGSKHIRGDASQNHVKSPAVEAEKSQETSESSESQAIIPSAKANSSSLPTDLDGATPLHWAARLGNITLLKRFLKVGSRLEAVWPQVDGSTDRSEATPLHWAAIEGQLDCMVVLLDAGANIEATNTWNRTPLHLASRFGHFQVVKLLVERGANLEARRDTNETPLHFAVEEDRLEVVNYLLDVGAEIDARGSRGTPLNFARQQGRTRIVELLESRGASD
ncbi:Ankyrin-2 [Dactylella cylindrospora]|nr:Ankyrin-2 [Dactylella cylindrospora]